MEQQDRPNPKSFFPHPSSDIKLLLLSAGNGGGVGVREDRRSMAENPARGSRDIWSLREAQGLTVAKETPRLGKRGVGTLVEEEALQVRLSDLANKNMGSSVKFEFQKNHN